MDHWTAAETEAENWDFATHVVSLVVRPNGEGLAAAHQQGLDAVLVATEEPDVVAHLVMAMAIFASELPPDVVTAVLDRLADDERDSRG